MAMAKKRTKKPKPAGDNPWPERLRTLRKEIARQEGLPRPLTQAQAAARLGVSTRTWIAWENNQRIPGRLTQRLLKAEFPDQL